MVFMKTNWQTSESDIALDSLCNYWHIDRDMRWRFTLTFICEFVNFVKFWGFPYSIRLRISKPTCFATGAPWSPLTPVGVNSWNMKLDNGTWHVGPNLGTIDPYFCGWKEELRRIWLIDQVSYDSSGWSFARGWSIWMIICKRQVHPDDHLQEAGPFRWSFAFVFCCMLFFFVCPFVETGKTGD